MNVEAILAAKGREVRTIRPDAALSEALQRLRQERIGALVVTEDGARIAGIVSDRGIMNAIADRGTAVLDEPVRAVMTEKVFTCTPADRVSAVMSLMTGRRIRHIPVVDEERRLCGIISIGDVVKQRLDDIQGEAEAMREYISSAG